MSRSAVLLAAALVASCGDDERVVEVPGDPPAAEPACEGYELLGTAARDLTTGLVWDRLIEPSPATAEEADALCAARGARVPTRAELEALRTPGGADGCLLPACPFLGDRCATLQCSTPIADTGARWGVAMSGGALVMVDAGQAEALLCVR